MQTKHSQLFSTHTYPTQKKIKRYSLTLSSFSPHVSLLGASQRNSKTVILLYFLRHTHQKIKKREDKKKMDNCFFYYSHTSFLTATKIPHTKKTCVFVLIIIIIITTPPPPQRSFLFSSCWITAERCMIDSTGRWLKGRNKVGVCVSNFKDTDFTLVVAPRLEHIW